MKVELVDQAGNQPFMTVFGDLPTVTRSADIMVKFEYNNATVDTTPTVSGTGSTGNASSLATVSTGVGVGLARLETVRSIRYRAGFAGYAMFTTAYTTPEANTVQRHGPFGTDNGFWVGYNGTTFSVAYRKAGSDNVVAVDMAELTWLDTTKLNLYRVDFGFLGIAPITYWVHGGVNRGWIPMAVIDKTNTQVATHINQPMLPIRMEAQRTSGTGANLVVSTASWCGGTYGADNEDHVSARPFAATSSKTLSGSTLTNLLTIENQSTFQTLTNRVVSELLLLNLATDGTKAVEFRLLKGATLGGSPSYSNVDATNSVCRTDTAGTTVTGGTYVGSFFLSKVAQDRVYLADLGFEILPGEKLTIAAISTSASDVYASARWREMF